MTTDLFDDYSYSRDILDSYLRRKDLKLWYEGRTETNIIYPAAIGLRSVFSSLKKFFGNINSSVTLLLNKLNR
jgi:hypothetical protein